MDAIHRRIATPVVTDIRLEPGAQGVSVLAETVVPDRPPSLFTGSPLLLMGRYHGRPDAPIEVHGQTVAGGEWRESVVPSIRDNPAIASAWARGQVRQLEDRYAVGHGNSSGLEQTIVATSLRFGVLCRFTAYLAVDRSAVVNEGGESHTITQPVEMPAGWDEVRHLFRSLLFGPGFGGDAAWRQGRYARFTIGRHASSLRFRVGVLVAIRRDDANAVSTTGEVAQGSTNGAAIIATTASVFIDSRRAVAPGRL